MLHPDLSTTALCLLSLAAFAAGWLDAIAGGGGIVTLPALLAAGLPPHVALGTNKGQSVFGSSTALWRYWRAGAVDRAQARPTFLLGFAGALAGAQLVLFVPPHALQPLVLALLVVVAVLLAVRPQHAAPGAPRAHANVTRISAVIALVLGAYDGFFGPGTGTFLIAAFVLFLNAEPTHATANAKVVNFASNLASVALFSSSGTIAWTIALPMAAAQMAGAALGAQTALKAGNPLVRGVMLFVIAALVAKLALELVG